MANVGPDDNYLNFRRTFSIPFDWIAVNTSLWQCTSIQASATKCHKWLLCLDRSQSKQAGSAELPTVCQGALTALIKWIDHGCVLTVALCDGRLAGPHQQAGPQPQEPALVTASQGAALPLGLPPLCLLPHSQTLLRFSLPGLSLRTVTLRARRCFSLLSSESMSRYGESCIVQQPHVHLWRLLDWLCVFWDSSMAAVSYQHLC